MEDTSKKDILENKNKKVTIKEGKDKKINEHEINKKNIKNDLGNASEKVAVDVEKSKLNNKETKKKNNLQRINQCWENWQCKSNDIDNRLKVFFVTKEEKISEVMSKIGQKVADYQNSGLLDKIEDIYDQDKNTCYYGKSLSNGKNLYSDKLQKLADIFSGASEPSEIECDFYLDGEKKYWTLDFKHQDGEKYKLELKRKENDKITLKYTIDKIAITIKFPFKWLYE